VPSSIPNDDELADGVVPPPASLDPDATVGHRSVLNESAVVLCRGCYAELMELRRMVLDELPVIEDGYQGAYVALAVGDLRAVQKFAREIIIEFE